MPKVHQRRDTDAAMLCDKAKIVRGVMRNAKSIKIDIADPKFPFRVYLDRPFS
jgi:hypothetical protein